MGWNYFSLIECLTRETTQNLYGNFLNQNLRNFKTLRVIENTLNFKIFKKRLVYSSFFLYI